MLLCLCTDNLWLIKIWDRFSFTGKQGNSNKDTLTLDLFSCVYFNVGDAEITMLTFQFTECQKWKCVCEGIKGFLLPWQHFPFPPFGIFMHPSCISTGNFKVALYRFHTTLHRTASKQSFTKPQQVEWGVGSTWSQKTQPLHIHSVCDSYCLQRHQLHVSELQTNIHEEIVLILENWQEIEKPMMLYAIYTSRSSELNKISMQQWVLACQFIIHHILPS